jgi:Tol biopolymer transport system component
VAYDRFDPKTGLFDIWIHDLKRDAESRVTFNTTNNQSPEWSPDGKRLAFTSAHDSTLYEKSIDGAGPENVLDNKRFAMAADWSRDGRYLVELTVENGTQRIWLLPLVGDRKPFPYLQNEFQKGAAKLSPNGRWLAYASWETNRHEIYVESFPIPGGKHQVSVSGGENPTWSADGKEIFFISSDDKLMVVDVKAEDTFEASTPKPLFQPHVGFQKWYTVSPDGRFLIPVPVERSSAPTVNVVVNWTAGLKK